MGIRPYKAFTFDGKSSLDYGVYLTGEGVFNAPERAVEMLEIPGRNGSFILDQGRFQNISVTYKAGIVDYSETDFATRVSNVRNWLCSKVGYKRLEDDYNPNEYRMAAFVAGIEVDHADLQTGEFEITFDCKPQRWLTSGETAVSVTSGDTITNPTLFASEPLLQVNGSGELSINGEKVNVGAGEIGDVLLANTTAMKSGSSSSNFDVSNYSLLQNGDTVTLIKGSVTTIGFTPLITPDISISSVTLTAQTGDFTIHISTRKQSYSTYWDIVVDDDITWNKPTAATKSVVLSFSVAYKKNGTSTTYTGTVGIGYYYRNNPCGISLTYTQASPDSNDIMVSRDLQSGTTKIGTVQGYSTMTTVSDEKYIDLEMGEAWVDDGGSKLSINNIVQMPSELPKLKPGTNEITYDNTFTSFDIVPRWWKV